MRLMIDLQTIDLCKEIFAVAWACTPFHFPPPDSYNPAMAHVHDRCICLRKVEYSETSQILLLFSREHGLQKVIAKGAHRRTKAGSSKFDGGADLLDVGHADRKSVV